MPESTWPQLKPGINLSPGSELHRRAVAAFTGKADRVMQRLQLSTPADGQMYEQIDKRTGWPASSRGIGWSHAAFLEAEYERKRLASIAPGASPAPAEVRGLVTEQGGVL
jgi:hypothetical protein